MVGEASGLGAAGLQVDSKLDPLNGGLGLRARGARLFAPIAVDRTHLDAARGSNGLRKRSAGAAAEMLVMYGHGSETRRNVHVAARVPSKNVFVMVKIA